MSLFHFWLGTEYQKRKQKKSRQKIAAFPPNLLYVVLAIFFIVWLVNVLLNKVGLGIRY